MERASAKTSKTLTVTWKYYWIATALAIGMKVEPVTTEATTVAAATVVAKTRRRTTTWWPAAYRKGETEWPPGRGAFLVREHPRKRIYSEIELLGRVHHHHPHSEKMKGIPTKTVKTSLICA